MRHQKLLLSVGFIIALTLIWVQFIVAQGEEGDYSDSPFHSIVFYPTTGVCTIGGGVSVEGGALLPDADVDDGVSAEGVALNNVAAEAGCMLRVWVDDALVFETVQTDIGLMTYAIPEVASAFGVQWIRAVTVEVGDPLSGEVEDWSPDSENMPPPPTPTYTPSYTPTGTITPATPSTPTGEDGGTTTPSPPTATRWLVWSPRETVYPNTPTFTPDPNVGEPDDPVPPDDDGDEIDPSCEDYIDYITSIARELQANDQSVLDLGLTIAFTPDGSTQTWRAILSYLSNFGDTDLITDEMIDEIEDIIRFVWVDEVSPPDDLVPPEEGDLCIGYLSPRGFCIDPRDTDINVQESGDFETINVLDGQIFAQELLNAQGIGETLDCALYDEYYTENFAGSFDVNFVIGYLNDTPICRAVIRGEVSNMFYQHEIAFWNPIAERAFGMSVFSTDENIFMAVNRFIADANFRFYDPLAGTICTATASQNANLRAGPSTNNNVAGGVTAGDSLGVLGQNMAGDWYQIVTEDGTRAWIADFLVDASACNMDDVPVTE